jgi:hypothetical protein
MCETAAEWSVNAVITASETREVTDLLNRVGAELIPGQTYILPLNGRERMRDRVLGRAFHRQLESKVIEGLHPDDEQHDEQVGHALRLAIEGEDPERAMREYNGWAMKAGYEPVKYLGSFDGRLRADIKTAIIEVDDKYRVHVMEPICQ